MAALLVNWAGVFTPHVSAMEEFLRGSVMYFALLALVRIIPRRTVGVLATMDLLVIILTGEAAGNALGVESLGDGIVVVATVIGWSYVLNWLTHTVPAIERLISPRPLPIVQNGRPLPRNLRAELLTDDELMRRLRLEGIEDVAAVKAAYVESDGSISVIKYPEDGRR